MCIYIYAKDGQTLMERKTEMEVDMEYVMELAFSGCSSTSSTTGFGDLAWVDWSPAVDWGHFAVDNEFNGLLEHYGLPCTPAAHDWSTNVSPNSTNCPGTPVEEFRPELPPPAEFEKDNDRGLRLVHLLMAAAEALTGANKSSDLARVILARLRELLAEGGETNMERLAEHFTDALQRLLDGVGRHDDQPPNSGEVLEAFQLLQDMSPYVKFGHFTANQAILEAVAGERRVHIVDYDIMEGVQWASLMQAMVSQQETPPLAQPPHLRITAVTRFGGSRRSGTAVLDTGRRLSAFAASVGLSFSFGQCRLDADDQLRPAGVKVVKGEAVVLNCALHPPHLAWRSAASIASFLGSAGELGARLVTVVEGAVAVAGGGGDGNGGFVGSFMEEMKRYSAMWDSLEAGFPMQEKARGAVERLILGPMIAGSVGRAYRRREEGVDEREGWAEWMEEAGSRRIGLSLFNLCQSRLLLGLFNDGYKVVEEGPNKLVLCWKNCRLLSASVWSAPAVESPAASCFSWRSSC